MTLTLQFIIIAILPLSFLTMLGYAWRMGLRRQQIVWRWLFTLLLAAIWSSSILRFFGGVSFGTSLVFSWGVVGKYAFALTALGVLLTTFRSFATLRPYQLMALSLGGLLWAGAIALDPLLWAYSLPPFDVNGLIVRQFDLWAAVWIASWIVPITAAYTLTRRVAVGLPSYSLYRNQVHYWQLLLLLFFIGGVLNSIQQPGQPGWQQAGVIFVALAAFVGTGSLSQRYLPDLQLGVRHLFGRLTGSLIIFALAWFGIWFLARGISQLPAIYGQTIASQNFIIVLIAGIFAALVTILYPLATRATRRLISPTSAQRETVMTSYANAIGNLPEPAPLGKLFLRLVQSNLDTNDAWLFVTRDGPGGSLLLQPLAHVGEAKIEPLQLAPDNPLTHFFRHNTRPLVHRDIDSLETFAAVPADLRQKLAGWERVLYLALHVGNSLIGVVALGEKNDNDSYDRPAFEQLLDLAEQFSPLLAQAQNIASLRQINEYVFQQNQILLREKRHLQELANLYGQFIRLISPELRQPFAAITQQIEALKNSNDDGHSAQKEAYDTLSAQIAALKTPLDNLITLSARIQTREQFQFELVNIEDVAINAIRKLRKMADARRVEVSFNPQTALPAVLGDAAQLQEAVQHLLHNAIKYNKIGGVVTLECGVEGSHLYLRVVDTGVGIPEDRLPEIWAGFQNVHENGSSRGGGLGLALTRFITAAHGGHVKARSKYGSGSVFAIYLPLVFEEA